MEGVRKSNLLTPASLSSLDQATSALPQDDAPALTSQGEMLVEPSELLTPSGPASGEAAVSNDQAMSTGDGATTNDNAAASTTAAAPVTAPGDTSHTTPSAQAPAAPGATCCPAPDQPKHAFAPLSKIHLAFHAYHVPAHDRTQVVEAYHFCSGCATGGNDTKVYQCLIYDSPEKDARLIGVEYVSVAWCRRGQGEQS